MNACNLGSNIRHRCATSFEGCPFFSVHVHPGLCIRTEDDTHSTYVHTYMYACT